MRGWVRTLGSMVAIVASIGCAATASTSRGHDRVISHSELTTSAETNLYDAIDRLRPGWLGPDESPDPVGRPVVYMNRMYLGDATTLSSVRSRDVVEVRLVPPSVAQARYGAENPAGVIELVTRDLGAY